MAERSVSPPAGGHDKAWSAAGERHHKTSRKKMFDLTLPGKEGDERRE